MYGEDGKLHGVEAVIDKDLAASLLAEGTDADLLVIATDVDEGVYRMGNAGAGETGFRHRRGRWSR